MINVFRAGENGVQFPRSQNASSGPEETLGGYYLSLH